MIWKNKCRIENEKRSKKSLAVGKTGAEEKDRVE